MTENNTFATLFHAIKMIDFNDNFRSKKEQYARIIFILSILCGIPCVYVMTLLPSANWFWYVSVYAQFLSFLRCDDNVTLKAKNFGENTQK